MRRTDLALQIRDKWTLATGGLLLLVATTIVMTVPDYGVTIDAKHSSDNGHFFLSWYTSGFADRTVIDHGNHYLYGSFFNALTAIAERVSPIGRYETGHLLIAVTGLVGIFYVWLTGKLLAGSPGGFLSAAILVLTPTWYGHMFMNPKDVPFAVVFVIALYYMLRAYDRLPKPTRKDVMVLGVVVGLALAIRIGALLLFGYAAVLVILWLLSRSRRDAGRARDVRDSVLTLIKVGVVAWVVMLPWWPYALLNPIINPLGAFRRAAKFTDFTYPVLFEGRFFAPDALPWYYLPKTFLITLPEIYAVAFVGGVAALAVARFRIAPEKRNKLFLVAFAAFFPIVSAVIMRPILYDSNRHFLFAIPPLAILSGVGLASIFRANVPGKVKTAFVFAATVTAGLTFYDMSRLHPYQYVYYNRSSGGLRAALGRYETDYWGQSYKEGVQWLIGNYRRDATPESIGVANTFYQFQTAYYLERGGSSAARFTPVEIRQNPHVMLSTTRWNSHLKNRGRVLHVVERAGVPLLYVVELRQ